MNAGPMIGRILIFAGIVLVVLGALLAFGGRVPLLGKLPGDITIERGNVRIFIPLGTSVVLSVLASAVVWLISVFRGR